MSKDTFVNLLPLIIFLSFGSFLAYVQLKEYKAYVQLKEYKRNKAVVDKEPINVTNRLFPKHHIFDDSIPESLRKLIYASDLSDPIAKITNIKPVPNGLIVEWKPIKEVEMPTDSERYGHAEMTDEQLEHRIASDMYELSNRLQANEDTKAIGFLIWSFMRKTREAYRTASSILKG